MSEAAVPTEATTEIASEAGHANRRGVRIALVSIASVIVTAVIDLAGLFALLGLALNVALGPEVGDVGDAPVWSALVTAGTCALHLLHAQLLRRQHYSGCVFLRCWALAVAAFGMFAAVSFATASS